jgi:hypothetical protein
MTWQPPSGSFIVDKPTDGWVKAPWVIEEPIKPLPVPEWQLDENLKKSFGIELAKSNSFDAVRKLAGDDASKAQWMHTNWLCDPVVVASRDAYLKTLELSSTPLDKEQLAAKVLALADEKVLNLKTGQQVPLNEAKDRIAAFKLYSEIMGYTGKVEIDASTKTITHNEMIIKLVKAETKAPVTINNPMSNPNPNTKISESPSPITLKLVGGASH